MEIGDKNENQSTIKHLGHIRLISIIATILAGSDSILLFLIVQLKR